MLRISVYSSAAHREKPSFPNDAVQVNRGSARPASTKLCPFRSRESLLFMYTKAPHEEYTIPHNIYTFAGAAVQSTDNCIIVASCGIVFLGTRTVGGMLYGECHAGKIVQLIKLNYDCWFGET